MGATTTICHAGRQADLEVKHHKSDKVLKFLSKSGRVLKNL